MSRRMKNARSRVRNLKLRARGAFTLLEVMIAVGILFMCLFAILALLGNSLRSARLLQRHRALDTATVDGLVYVQAVSTNQLTEDCGDLDLSDLYPDAGYKGHWCPTLAGTNGLWQIDVEVDRNNQLELQSHFMVYNPGAGNGQGISKNLRSH